LTCSQNTFFFPCLSDIQTAMNDKHQGRIMGKEVDPDAVLRRNVFCLACLRRAIRHF